MIKLKCVNYIDLIPNQTPMHLVSSSNSLYQVQRKQMNEGIHWNGNVYKNTCALYLAVFIAINMLQIYNPILLLWIEIQVNYLE